VRLLGTDGAPKVGRPVTFAVTTGTGSLAPALDSTDVNGAASTILTLGATAGPVTVDAAVPGTTLVARFTATVEIVEPDSTLPADQYNPDWTLATHGNVPPDYATVFPQAVVRSIAIDLTASQWSSVRANMTQLFGFDFGTRLGAGSTFPSTNPDYIAARVRVDGKQWKKVGFRLKGNSSLANAWGAGNLKLPFRLKFSEFQGTYPAIAGQRFHGFKELSFSPGFMDQSLIREKVTADIFRAAGVPAARTAFYRVVIDIGAGPRYIGMYAAVEVIDDSMVEDQYGEDAGNLYKPESQLQTFVQAEFEKKNNKTAADYGDVQAFVAALNSPLRTGNAAAWRTALEATFDVDHFLRYLAVNNTIVNWDSYGTLAHNYYLYHHPSRGLVWIPWDHNEALAGNPGVTGGSGSARGGLSLSMSEVTAQWPLLRYLADDPVYLARYKSHLRGVRDSVFTESAMDALFESATALVAPFATGANGEQPGATYLSSAAAFAAALPALRQHVRVRRALVATYVP
jgi:spore coat protein H